MSAPGQESRTAGVVPRWVLALGALGLVGLALYELRGVLTPIFLALAIAYLLDPLVEWWEGRGLPRGLAITLVLTLLLAAVALFLLLVVPSMIREVVHFLSEIPRELAELQRRVEPWLRDRGVVVPHDLDEAIAALDLAPSELASQAAEPVQAAIQVVLGGTLSVIGAITSALIVPVLAFYLLYDFNHITAGARDLVPPRIRPWVVEVASEIDGVLGHFVRGQLLVMVALGTCYALAYSLVGIRLAIPIGMVAGLLAFIPYVGGGAALGMGLLMCVIDWDGQWYRPVGVVVAYAVVQLLEGFVIVPRIVGEQVGLPAVTVLLALLIGGEVFGFLGVLLALPVAAVLKIFVVRGMRWYKQSALYRDAEGVEIVERVVRATEPPPEVPPTAAPSDDEPGSATEPSGAADETPPAPVEPDAGHPIDADDPVASAPVETARQASPPEPPAEEAPVRTPGAPPPDRAG